MAELAWLRLQWPSPHILRLTHRNQILQVLASSSQPCRVAGRLLQLSQLCAGGTDTLSRNLRHRRRGARHQLMTARQSPILPVVTAAGSHHLACRCRRSRLQLRWVAEEQSRLLDRLFHACTFGMGHLLASGTPVPAGCCCHQVRTPSSLPCPGLCRGSPWRQKPAVPGMADQRGLADRTADGRRVLPRPSL